MKAAVLYGKEDVRVEEVPSPPLQPGEVRIQIEAALTCGTDLKVYRRGYHAAMIKPPAVFGHELAGTVVELGQGSAEVGWAKGDRVVVANSAPCGQCTSCRNAQENLCDDLIFLNGAYAESIAVPTRIVQKNLLRLKPGTEFRDAALVEPLACVVLGVQDARLRTGQHVLIIGAGPIGLMFVALAKNLGCEVTVAGRGEKRLQTARRLGADHVLDVSGKDLTAAVRENHPRTVVFSLSSPEGGEGRGEEATGFSSQIPSPQPSPRLGGERESGAMSTYDAVRAANLKPFDAVIEAVGKPETWEAAVRLVRKGGTVNLFGGCARDTTVSLDTGLIHYSGLTLVASFHHTPATIRRALEFIESGVVRAADFVDGECPLSGLPDLFKQMTTGNRTVKTLIRVRD